MEKTYVVKVALPSPDDDSQCEAGAGAEPHQGRCNWFWYERRITVGDQNQAVMLAFNNQVNPKLPHDPRDIYENLELFQIGGIQILEAEDPVHVLVPLTELITELTEEDR